MTDELRDRGLRLTPQRELVLAAVRELGHAVKKKTIEKHQIIKKQNFI